MYGTFDMKNRKLNITAAVLLIILIHNIAVKAQDDIIRDSKGVVIPKKMLTTISIDFKDTPIREAISVISEKGKLRFNYNEKIIPEETKITANLHNVYSLIALRNVLKNTGIDFVMSKNGQIVLIKIDNKDHEKKIRENVIDASIKEKYYAVNVVVENTCLRIEI